MSHPHHRTSRINARLDEERKAKLEFLKRSTGLSVSEIVKRGIDSFYEEQRTRRASALEILTRTGFIASGEGPEDLSVNYKDELTRILAEKHDSR